MVDFVVLLLEIVLFLVSFGSLPLGMGLLVPCGVVFVNLKPMALPTDRKFI